MKAALAEQQAKEAAETERRAQQQQHKQAHRERIDVWKNKNKVCGGGLVCFRAGSVGGDGCGEVGVWGSSAEILLAQQRVQLRHDRFLAVKPSGRDETGWVRHRSV